MGSCEDSIGVHGPLCRHGDDDDGDALDRRQQEQHLGLEFGKITGSEEIPCLETDAGLTGVIVEAGSGGHVFEKASSNDNAGTVDAGDVRDIEAPDRGIGSVVREGGNVVGVLPGKLSDDECGFITGCLDDGWAGTEECNGETTQLLVDKVETGGQIEGLVNFVDNCKSSLGVNVACGSPINCDQAYGPKDNRVGGDEGSMEEKSDGSPTRVTVNCDQLVFSPHHEVYIGQISVTGSPSNCLPHNDQDSIEQRTTDLYGIKTDEHDWDICSPSSGGVMEEKAVVLGGNETASTDFKNSKESKNMASSLIISAGQDKQKDDKPAGSPVEGIIMEKSNLFSRIDVPMSNETLSQLNSKADLSIQESHYDSEMSRRLSLVGDPENSSYNVNEQRDDKNVHLPSLGSMPEILDYKSDVTADTNIEICDEKLCTEENACNQKEASPEITLDSLIEKSVPPELCQPCDATENSSSERSDALYTFGKDDAGATVTGSAVNCSREMDNIGLQHAKNCCVTEMKCANIVSLSSRRRSRTSKSSRKTQTKRAGRKCGKKTRVPDMHESMEDFFKAGKRKRTCFSVPARSSVWGLFHNIAHLFKPGDGMGLDKVLDHPLERAKLGRDDGNSSKFQAGGSSLGAGGGYPVTNRRIRLKVKLGKEVGQTSLNMMAPESVDTSTSTNGLTSCNGTGSFQGTSCKISSLANNTENKLGDVGTKKVLDKANLSFDASAGNVCLTNSEPQRTVISEKPAGDAAEDQVPSQIEAGVLGAEIEKRYTDPGTSPDSEVINLDPECQVRALCQEYMNGTTLSSSKAFVTSGASCDKRAKKKERFPFTGSSSLEEMSFGSISINKAKATKTCSNGEENGDCFYSSEILTSSASANASSNSSSSKELSVERLSLSKEADIEVSAELLKAEINPEAKASGGVEVGLGSLKSQSSKSKLSSAVCKGNDIMENGRSKDLARSRRTNGHKKRGNERKSVNKTRDVDPSIHDHLVDKVKDEPESGNRAMGFTETADMVDNVASVDSVSTDVASSGATEQDLSVDNAWVRCDDCYKWRRIPVELVDFIGQANCQWFCKDNLDKAFADCSVTQEKSNDEINAELGISDVEEDVCDVSPNTKGLECGHTMASKEYEFTHISTNRFLHRSRKTQSIDEIMVCHCVPPKDGSLGCGEECLNRMLNIECVQGTCPCGDLCSNQQFQNRSYAKMMWDRFGKKGFGLRLEDDISKGQFLIEYVGEVLDVHAYAARLKEYANKGHKHFYFMTLDNSEVIDASAKGNLGRFINHSCDPNCRTEKWVVNGEICIGIFALRDIKKGEEVTFDYNYVRVVGAAAKKCYCGSLQCRGYIGGDPTTAEVIDQVDSDEEFPEPVMLESGEDGDGFKKMTSRTSISSVQMKCADRRSKDGDEIENLKPCVGKLEVSKEVEVPIKESASSNLQIKSSSEMDESKQNLPHSCQQVEVSSQAVDVTSKSTSAVQQSVSMEETVYNAPGSIQILEASPPSTLGIASIATAASRKSKSPIAENKSASAKLGSRIKTSNHSSSIKKGKMTSNALDVNKSSKPKIEGSSASRFEAVQEKLNELLDGDGGISKRKDAPKGYLKLLLLTAASGASANGEGSYGNRDLSMILDALLKTKSRAVLTDIINKNGLRMLHNMIKQCRRDFKRTPILRKLLKVLEYLAVREILTQEHINGGPPCPGMERFRDSMLSLTEHDDKTVHQIARNFRDRWIPRNFRRYGYTDREDGRMNFHRSSSNCDRVSVSHNYWHDQSVRPTEATDTVIQSKLPTDSGEAAIQKNSSAPHMDTVTKTRKRKSRWDQPAEENPVSRSLQCDGQKTVVPEMEKGVLVEKISREDSYCSQCFQNYCKQDEVINEDAPPGFSSPINPAHISPNASSAVAELPGQNAVHLKFPIGGVVGHLQAKFNSRLPVAYGIPLPVVQKYGSAQAEPVESWIFAPGLPFHPFPPLPPFPNQKKEIPASCVVNSMAMDETAEGKQLGSRDSPTCLPKENGPRVTGGDHQVIDVPSANCQQTLKRARGPSCDLGRRYFRQQKRNKVPPWMRNGWGFCGNNSRGGICSKDIGSETNENRNFYSSYDASHREERAGNSFNRQPQHQN